jgi:hypothetical protein
MNHRSLWWIRKRLRSLAILELINVPLQAVVWFGVVGFPVTAANVGGFALFALVLLEGAGYWWAKLRRITVAGRLLPAAGVFAAARVANVLVLIVGLLFGVWAVITAPGTGSWPGLGFAIFAALEHVNYFHVQLMYDNVEDLRYLRTHGLRRAHLGRDLALKTRTHPATAQRYAQWRWKNSPD